MQNARIKSAAYKASQVTLERRKKDKDHYKQLFDKAQENYNLAYRDVEHAREACSEARCELYDAIEKETC